MISCMSKNDEDRLPMSTREKARMSAPGETDYSNIHLIMMVYSVQNSSRVKMSQLDGLRIRDGRLVSQCVLRLERCCTIRIFLLVNDFAWSGILDNILRLGSENQSFPESHDSQDEEHEPGAAHDDSHDMMQSEEAIKFEDIAQSSRRRDPAHCVSGIISVRLLREIRKCTDHWGRSKPSLLFG